MPPTWAAIETKCPIGATHQALVDATSHMGLAGTAYHKPDLFLLHLNAFIQALRNITFRLQSEKAKIPEFAAWYADKQAAMRTDPLLRRFHDARNKVVKQAGLASSSRLRSGLFSGRHMKLAVEHAIPVSLESAAALKRLQEAPFGMKFVGPDHAAIGEQLGVERTWVLDEIGEGEVFEHCVIALNRLGDLVSEAHALLGSPFRVEPILVDEWDRQELQVLLETDVDPSLSKKWGWDDGAAAFYRFLRGRRDAKSE